VPITADMAGKVRADWVVTRQAAGLAIFELTNQSTLGYINSFEWLPPAGITITGIADSSGASCVVSANTIGCSGKIAPPTCTCLPGGRVSMTISYRGTLPNDLSGWNGPSVGTVRVETVTPVPWTIPHSLAKPGDGGITNGELPLCKAATKATKHHPATKAQVSTKAHPCVMR
jgi:hypothetical protein